MVFYPSLFQNSILVYLNNYYYRNSIYVLFRINWYDSVRLQTKKLYFTNLFNYASYLRCNWIKNTLPRVLKTKFFKFTTYYFFSFSNINLILLRRTRNIVVVKEFDRIRGDRRSHGYLGPTCLGEVPGAQRCCPASNEQHGRPLMQVNTFSGSRIGLKYSSTKRLGRKSPRGGVFLR
jgi:hypothetical protein